MVQSPSLLRPPASEIAASSAARRIGSSAIRDLLRLTERDDVISLAGGLPDPDTFPHAAVAASAARVLATEPAAALQYSVTEGYTPLREWIAVRRNCEIARTTAASTTTANPDGVLVTHGSQQALDLVLRAFVDPGDAVVVVDPCYVGALQLLRMARADIVGIGSDSDGMRVDELADRLHHGLRPRAVYVVANFHNPTGATLSLERRRVLAALADRYGFLVIDDDPYGELRWSGTALPPLASLTDRVVTLGSFSKVLSPGMRVGYAVATPAVIADLTIVKQAADLHTSSLSQRIVYDVVSQPGFFDDHVRLLCEVYGRRASTLSDALQERLEGRVCFDEPAGGMFVWAQWTSDTSARGAPIDTQAMLATALDAGVAFVPGAAFAVAARSNPHPSGFRLSFATASETELDEAVRRLATLVALSPFCRA